MEAAGVGVRRRSMSAASRAQRHPYGQDGKGFGGAHHQQGVTLPDGSDREVLQQ